MTQHRPNSVLLIANAGPTQQAIVQNLQAVRLPVEFMAWADGGDVAEFAADVALESQSVAVVIVDLEVMRDNGIALCERLHVSRGSDVQALPKLVALGVENEHEFEDTAYRVGCDMVLARPFTNYELLERLRAMDIWKLRQAHRAYIKIPVTWLRPDGSSCAGETVDISETGVQFRSEQPIPKGQNVPVQLQLTPGVPPVSVWSRVVRCVQADNLDAQHTAVVAVNFLNLSPGDREELSATIGRARKAEELQKQEEEAAKELELAEPDQQTIVNDYHITQVVEWILFLINPAAFGGPPPSLASGSDHLTKWIHRLAPHEERLFVLHGAVKVEVPQDKLWLRAWTAFRTDLSQTATQAPNPDRVDGDAVDKWVAAARSMLELLDSSLAVWDQFKVGHEELNLQLAEQTLLLTLREALVLRDAYEKLRDESDPQFLGALRRAEEYFEHRDFDTVDAGRYSHHIVPGTGAKSRVDKRPRVAPRTTRTRLVMRIVGVLILLGASGFVAYNMLY